MSGGAMVGVVLSDAFVRGRLVSGLQTSGLTNSRVGNTGHYSVAGSPGCGNNSLFSWG